MLSGKNLGAAINEAIRRKIASGGAKSKAEIARHFGIKPPSIHDWINKGSISKDKLPELFDYFSDVVAPDHWGINKRTAGVAQIIRSVGIGIENTAPAPDTKGLVPLISWVEAGGWNEAEDHYSPGDGERFIPCIASHGMHSYALRVHGDSMTASHGPTFPEGCIIFVDPDQRGGVGPGDKVIAKINGADGVTFKVLSEDGGRPLLIPLNKQFPTITDEFRVIGKVIGKWEDV